MKQTKNKQACLRRQGFTLIEILVVIGIIAILAAVVLVALNPARQFAQARDSQRRSNVNAILDAIGQNVADNKGLFNCADSISTSTSEIISDDGADLRLCIVPDYMSEIPVDPVSGEACADDTCADYDTGYSIVQSSSTGRITVSANGEVPAGSIISVTR